ncbi:MAG TPA: RecQ family ATP-dependent DNA helicase [Micromonosporaceae bacterium]|nr:RecQ family ATP-dependent DNA helicase [Micromonosporaceae bacterium]
MSDSELRRVAAETFGWRLRPEQLAGARAVLAGRDALVVLPTGAGKSAVYQVPGVLRPGPTVVVSPLLALQRDQMAALAQWAGTAAVQLTGETGPGGARQALAAVRAGEAEFLFLTPEQLSDPQRLAQVRRARPSLVAVDEAHCVSAWGYDFRPDYLQLGRFIDELGGPGGRPPVVALTATASPPVREDIVARLHLSDPVVVVSGLDRPNIFLEAVHCPDERTRWDRLVRRVLQSPPPGIVYTSTRRSTQELAEALRGAGVTAAAYHAGMRRADRERVHADFMADRVAALVATSAFGMGIDKPDVRWVNHVALPDSLDSYAHEVGRAGRDGEPAQALLLYRTEDTGLRRFFAGGTPPVEQLEAVARTLAGAGAPLSRTALRERTGLGPRRLARMVALLEQVGAAVPRQRNRLARPPGAPPPGEAARLAAAEADRLRTVELSRVEMMLQYARTTGCRGQFLLGYLGEALAEPCGHCDSCASGAVGGTDAAEGPFPVHATVRHEEFGTGTVLRYEEDRMVVLFDRVGYRTLSVPVVVEQGLIEADDGS